MNNKQTIRKLKNLPAGIEIFRDLNSNGSIMDRSTIIREYSLIELKGLTIRKAKRYFLGELEDYHVNRTKANYVQTISDSYELELEVR